MINKVDHSIGWAFLLDELEDAHEHLEALLKEIAEVPDYAEENLRIDLAHIFAHLNRAWYGRNVPEDMDDASWEKACAFPKDLDPI